MAKARRDGIAILTANDLMTGRKVYWTGAAWSKEAGEAARTASEDGRAGLTAIAAREEAHNRVVGAALVVLDPITYRAVELRERHRMAGPSIPLPTRP